MSIQKTSYQEVFPSNVIC